mmetsp:Transcript_83173/g.269275  ORF Transcript_83173/g.269275 Transcript_83173/m.269275 type:complete len:840 (+) Transcript_83173:85-2604(+)|eukprot:CAMPEP_0203860086 /NCGR_PEP_ID=MMETSP0359-20131031/12224_1 /ASSEMBLY_ACC=CAM_ASM_000338 /TAXON_ID=268821 /ORGANISM="Scrippsiella Hangoei, Strain SHTV-5" /LENGTH=839 /DNA_ID=CAMNT_0050777105 /DNA_START=83 /DNA_END=2602 /DNA_ORIENTATION=+
MAPLSKKVAQRKKRNEDLLESAMSGRHKDVARLLEEGADIDFQDRAGYTAFSEAASAGHAVVVGQLLRSSADTDRPAQDGRTALHRACWQNWVPVVRLLLENGADAEVKDEDGATAMALARTGVMRELFLNYDLEKHQAAAEERRKKRADLPAAAAEEDDEEDEPRPADGAAKAAEAKFEPPPRTIAEKREEEAKAKAEKESKRAEREKKYQEALDEITAQYGEDGSHDGLALANMPTPLVARVRVVGAGEQRLNGDYRVAFASKERAEFLKEDDDVCQIVWTEYQNEWRMLIGDYKLGNALYRHKYRPNTKADDRLGTPKKGWQAWFGKTPLPRVEFLANLGTPEYDEEMKVKAEEQKRREEEEREREEAQANSENQPPKTAAGKREFMEIRSSLDIVAPSVVPMNTDGGRKPHKGIEVSLHGGERLVETADGLFSPGEVAEDDEGGVGITEVDTHALALAWLEEEVGNAPEVPARWDAVQAAKAAAQELFGSGKVGDARQATTAALKAARRLLRLVEDPGPDDEIPLGGGKLPTGDEIEKFIGVLHSNRSLLLLQQINAADSEVLKHGTESAWNMVAKDADKALTADPANFKASFRRARAFFELGELEGALADANRVVDHYVKNSSTPNPEAANLRDLIIQAAEKERRKFGQRAPTRWNRGSDKPLITEVGAVGASVAAAEFRSADRRARGATPAVRPVSVPATASRGPPAPRTGGEVEKALLSTLKGDAGKRLAYVKEHLGADVLRKLFRRTPPGPDLLAALVRVFADLAEAGDEALAGQLLSALGEAPSARTQAAMFDADERACLQLLLGRLGPEAGSAWKDATVDEPAAQVDDA